MNKSGELISVVIPFYNTGEYLNRCVKSILGQTYKNLEVILINDGSTDNSSEFANELSKLDSRVKVYDIQHSGPGAARNCGIEFANGVWIHFMDSDDWLDSDTYEYLVSHVDEEHIDAVYGEWIHEYISGNEKKKKSKKKQPKEHVEKYFGHDNILNNYFRNKVTVKKSTAIIRKDTIGDIRFDEFLRMGEDVWFGFCVLCECRGIVKTNKRFYHRLHRVGSITCNKEFNPHFFDKIEAVKKIDEYIIYKEPGFAIASKTKLFDEYLVFFNRYILYKGKRKFLPLYNRAKDEISALYFRNKAIIPITKRILYFAFLYFLPLYKLCVYAYYMGYKSFKGDKAIL